MFSRFAVANRKIVSKSLSGNVLDGENAVAERHNAR
jgi:hypothetical protein